MRGKEKRTENRNVGELDVQLRRRMEKKSIEKDMLIERNIMIMEIPEHIMMTPAKTSS